MLSKPLRWKEQICDAQNNRCYFAITLKRDHKRERHSLASYAWIDHLHLRCMLGSKWSKLSFQREYPFAVIQSKQLHLFPAALISHRASQILTPQLRQEEPGIAHPKLRMWGRCQREETGHSRKWNRREKKGSGALRLHSVLLPLSHGINLISLSPLLLTAPSLE